MGEHRRNPYLGKLPEKSSRFTQGVSLRARAFEMTCVDIAEAVPRLPRPRRPRRVADALFTRFSGRFAPVSAGSPRHRCRLRSLFDALKLRPTSAPNATTRAASFAGTDLYAGAIFLEQRELNFHAMFQQDVEDSRAGTVGYFQPDNLRWVAFNQ
jgi:hypothetical protein